VRGEGRRAKDEGRGAKGEGRRAKDEGRRTRGEGRRAKDEGRRTRGEGPGARGEGPGASYYLRFFDCSRFLLAVLMPEVSIRINSSACSFKRCAFERSIKSKLSIIAIQ
jgi:hypothetical protein